MKNPLFTVLGLVVLTIPLTSPAQFTYTTNNGTITITGYSGPGGSVTIPSTINGLPVTTIGNHAFDGDAITSITMPDNVIAIGVAAFQRCTNLTSANIPGSVASIGDNSFWGCSSLTGTVTIPGRVTNLGSQAFFACMSVTNVTISDGVTSLGVEAFRRCAHLTNIFIPGSVSSIGFGAFAECWSLSVISVDAANADYSSLDGVLLNKDHTVLVECPGGKTGKYSIPGSVTSIEDEAFYGCFNLTIVTIPNGVTNIGVWSFHSSSLTAAFFEGNAPSAGSGAFDFDNATLYYLPGTTGWGTTFAGRPAVLWNPLMQSSAVRPSGFGFNITGTADIPIVIEATTSLANSAWVPLQSLNLTNGAFYFSDPNWTNYPARFYRIRSP